MGTMSKMIAGAIAAASLGIYGQVFHYLTFDDAFKGVYKFIPQTMVHWGQWGYLTYQCLILQMISMLLHIVGSFYKPARGLRDSFFTTLAQPTACCVVLTFWAVWFGISPEFIMPSFVRPYIPNYVNQVIHTLPLAVNLILMSLVHHRYPKKGEYLTITYLIAYFCSMYVMKFDTGHFPYPYVESMSHPVRFLYLLANIAFLYGLYTGNKYISNAIHGEQSQAQIDTGSQKKDQSQSDSKH